MKKIILLVVAFTMVFALLAYTASASRSPLSNFQDGNTEYKNIFYISEPDSDAVNSGGGNSIDSEDEKYIYLDKGDPGEDDFREDAFGEDSSEGDLGEDDFGDDSSQGDLGEDDFGIAKDGESLYIKGRLMIISNDDASFEHICKAIATVSGEITDVISRMNMYYIRVDEETEEGLLALSDNLMRTYPELFLCVIVEYLPMFDVLGY